MIARLVYRLLFRIESAAWWVAGALMLLRIDFGRRWQIPEEVDAP